MGKKILVKKSSFVSLLKVEGEVSVLQDIINEFIYKFDGIISEEPKLILPNPEGGDPKEEAYIVIIDEEKVIDEVLEKLEDGYEIRTG